MIRINSYLHRRALSDLIRRWMYNDLHPADAEQITRLINFNQIYVTRYLSLFADRIFRALYPTGVIRRPVLRKGELKDALVAVPPVHSERIDELIRIYRDHPERFYRETPVHGVLFFTQESGKEQLIGSSRIKRDRRLAEKASRRIVDRLFDAIRKHAESLADDRARRLGIPREQLVTPAEEMLEEFLKAESRLLDDLCSGKPVLDDIRIDVNDVAGIKLILEASRQEKLMAILSRLPDTEVTEVEPHSGSYNATNLIICHRPDREHIISRPLGGRILTVMQKRGMDSEQTQQAFAEFVRTGEESISLEIIVSNYQETLESEMGRCMHEERIISQRLNQHYRGFLSRNIEYLMEYLLAFPMSAQCELKSIPIRLWNRYLPDYIDEVLKDLFHIPSAGLLDEPPF